MRRGLLETGWWLMLILAALVATYAAFFLLVPNFGSPTLKQKLFGTATAMYAHLIGGAFAIVTGPWQFRESLRARRPHLHRKLGWLYSLAVAVGGVAGLRLAMSSDGGLMTHIGFGLLGLAWLITLMIALVEVKQHDFEAHRVWMMRNYSLTLAAVTLRIELTIVGILGLSFPVAYQWISWLSWVPNLAIAEWYIQRSAASQPDIATTAGSGDSG